MASQPALRALEAFSVTAAQTPPPSRMSMAVPMVSPMKMSELDTRDSFVLRPGGSCRPLALSHSNAYCRSVFDNVDRWTGGLLWSYEHVKSCVIENTIFIDRRELSSLSRSRAAFARTRHAHEKTG